MSIFNTKDGLPDPDDPKHDPEFKKLVEAMLFNKRFLKTHNIALLGILLIFTSWHWGQKIKSYRRKKLDSKGKGENRSNGQETEVWSSSSSTIGGSATPPTNSKTDDADETSPLLLSQRTQQRKQSTLSRLHYKLKSSLQYQPPNLPIINRPLPTNGVTLLIITWLALINFYNTYHLPYSYFTPLIFADRCGILFVSTLPLHYLLAAKNSPLHFLTGYSYETLNIFHRRVGEVLFLQALQHFGGMMVHWYLVLRYRGYSFGFFISHGFIILGLTAFVTYLTIFLTSLSVFRKRWYEAFLVLHVVLQAAGLVILWFHHETSRPYVGIALAIFLIDRVMYRARMKSSTHPATLTVLEDGETVMVSANWEVNASKGPVLSKSMKSGWKPSNHVFLSIPSLSRKHRIQAHPFTVFSAAPSSITTTGDAGKHAWFTLLIRAQAERGFTHSLLQHARLSSQVQIRLDGPYGSSRALDMLSSSSQAIVVAGGSGISVAYPLLYDLLQPLSADAETTVNRKSNKNVKLLWITHSPSHRLWIPEDKLNELVEWGLDVVIPPPTELAGRPDVQGTLRQWIEEERNGRAGVVVSGPDGLIRVVRNTCAGLLWEGMDVNVQVEKFGW